MCAWLLNRPILVKFRFEISSDWWENCKKSLRGYSTAAPCIFLTVALMPASTGVSDLWTVLASYRLLSHMVQYKEDISYAFRNVQPAINGIAVEHWPLERWCDVRGAVGYTVVLRAKFMSPLQRLLRSIRGYRLAQKYATSFRSLLSKAIDKIWPRSAYCFGSTPYSWRIKIAYMWLKHKCN